MKVFKTCCFFIFVFILLAIFIPEEAYSWNWRWRWKKPPPPKSIRRHKVPPKSQFTKYRYIRKYDFNGDGRINLQDRLLWLQKNEGNYTTIYISGDNEGLAEEMDKNKDGKVEPLEMKEFYKKYDSNENGVLEEEEIEAAVD